MVSTKTNKLKSSRESVKKAFQPKHWTRRHILVWAGFLLASLIVGLQLAYPNDRALPNARLGDRVVSGWQFNDVAATVSQEFIGAEITLRLTGDKSITYPLATTGAQPDTELIRQRLTDYPIWQRLIPLSALFKQPQVSAMPVYFTTLKLEQFSEQAAKQLAQPAQNAGLEIVKGELVATPDQPGVVIDSAELVAKLVNSRYSQTTTVVVPRSFVAADKPASFFKEVRDEALVLLEQKVVISVDDEEHLPNRAELASWFEISESEDGQAELALNQDSIKDYLKQLQASTRTPSGQTKITVVDGRETKRTVGETGRQIDTNALAKSLQTSLLEASDKHLVAQFVDIKPQVIINNTYTSTEAGLQAYVSDQVNTKNVRIAVEQLDGERWRAYGRADETTVSASTYKLYVALRLFEDIEKGKVNWNDKMLDTNVTGCFERMVVVSLNTCAETWIGQYGRSNLNQYLWNKGFSRGTDFNNPIATHTTAKDLTTYYRKLYEGSLMSKTSRQILLDALNRHGYTRGIPAGSKGRVHNKVGYLWDYSNDSAIVYHPEGVYTIAVLTKGLSFYAIADITREIERIMYP